MEHIIMNTPIGALQITEEDGYITAVTHITNFAVQETDTENAVLLKARQQLTDYFMGGLKEFDLPIKINVTPYRQKVLEQLMKVPFGQTTTYRELAEKTVLELAQKGKEVLFVGGTGLYLESMIHPMGMGQSPADPVRRDELRQMAADEAGKKELHALLEKLDPDTANRLPPNDIRRIIRAIEVTETTGVPFSKQPAREGKSPFDWTVVSLTTDRDTLYRRINRRVTAMIELGLKDEVRGLLEEGVPEDAQSMNGIGYRQMIPCVRGEYSLEEAAEEIRLASRHYAKRQMTFLRRLPEVAYLETDCPDTEIKLKEAML